MFHRWLSLLLTMLTMMGLSSYGYAGCAALTDKQIEAVKIPLKLLLTVNDANAEYGFVPVVAQQSIEQLKNALIKLVDARMACESASDLKADSIQQDLLRALNLSELDETQAIYGYDLQIVVQKSTDAVGLLTVQIDFGIPCGNDNLLLVYRYRDKAWHKDLVWKSNPYKSITGAYGDYYDYLLLPSKANETPKLVIIHSTPWCTSAWNPLSIDVVKLAEANKPQKSLLHRQVVVYSGADFNIDLKKLSTGFELRAKVGMLDSDLFIRQGIYRYQVDGDKVIRVQPVAENVRDFVDEWLTTDRSTAWQLSDKANSEELLATQAKLKERYGYYGSVKACQGLDEEYQVAMNFNGTQEHDNEELYYFIVKSTRYGYLVKSVSSEANPSCTGPDIMAK